MQQVKPDDPTIGKLVADASRDVSSLISQEIALAKAELKVSVKAGGTGIGLFVGAAVFGHLAIILLSATIAYFIHWAGLGLHWAFLIVTGVYLLIAGVLALIGVRKVRQARPPERAIEQAKETKVALTKRS